jgi:hypothetical protein
MLPARPLWIDGLGFMPTTFYTFSQLTIQNLRHQTKNNKIRNGEREEEPGLKGRLKRSIRKAQEHDAYDENPPGQPRFH